MSNVVDSGMADPQAAQNAEQGAACGKYAGMLLKQLQWQGKGQFEVDVLQDYMQLRIGQLHFQALLNEIARQTGFDMDALHREFVRRLNAEAARIETELPQVQIAIANAMPRKQ